MVILEALNALAGDCLLLRYPGPGRQGTALDHRRRAEGATATKDDHGLERRAAAAPQGRSIPSARRCRSRSAWSATSTTTTSTASRSSRTSLRSATPARSRGREIRPLLVQLVRQAGRSEACGTVGGRGGHGLAAVARRAEANLPGVDDEHATAWSCRASLRAMRWPPISRALRSGRQQARRRLRDGEDGTAEVSTIEGAEVTVIGPLAEAASTSLREEWAKALKKPTKKARQAALQELFLPKARAWTSRSPTCRPSSCWSRSTAASCCSPATPMATTLSRPGRSSGSATSPPRSIC